MKFSQPFHSVKGLRIKGSNKSTKVFVILGQKESEHWYFVSKIVQTCFEKKIVLVIEKYFSKFKIESQECWNSSRTNWDVEKWKKQVRYILSKNKKTIWQLIVRKNWENMFCILWLLVGNVKPKPTPHCWGHQVQKIDTKAKF